MADALAEAGAVEAHELYHPGPIRPAMENI